MAFFRKSRRLLGGPSRAGAGRYRALVFLTLAAIGLVCLGAFHPAFVSDARARLAGPVSSFFETLRVPFAPLADIYARSRDVAALEREVARLRQENDELKGWQWRALDLERRLADLSALNKVVHEPGLDFVTAPIKARSIGMLRHSLLIGVGRDHGVNLGAAVLNGQGLVGLSYEVGPSTSRVRLLVDKGSKLLVSVGRGLETGVAAGTGGRYLAIDELGGRANVAAGDDVMTAGQVLPGQAVVPRGLRVGRIVSTPQGLRIDAYADFERLDYVSVLKPATEPTPNSANSRLEVGPHARLAHSRRDGLYGQGFAAPEDALPGLPAVGGAQ